MNNDPLHFLNQRNYGSFHRPLAVKLGLAAAALLSELIEIRSYAIEKSGELISHEKHGNGWIYATLDKVHERIGLSEKEQHTAINILKRLNLIEVVVFGVPAKRHFKIHDDLVLELLNVSKNDSSSSKTQTKFLQNANLVSPIGKPDTGEHTYKEPKEEPKEELSVTALPKSVAAKPLQKLSVQVTYTEKISLSSDELFSRAARERRDWTLEEISKAWSILSDYGGVVWDWWRFIEGTIDNIRRKIKSEKIIGEPKWNNKEKKKQSKKSQTFSENDTEKVASHTLVPLSKYLNL